MWTTADRDLNAEIASFYNNPLGAVLFLYPWGDPDGPLANYKGPNKYQERFLIDLGDEIRARKFDGVTPVRPIRMSISSGHGVGKSALIGMLSGFLMSTRPHMRGTVTANTGDQLQTKTWSAIQEWHARMINKHFFQITSERFWAIGDPAWKATWFMHPQSCAEENSEAFAGQHAKQSSSVYMFDESSNVPDKIWEVAEGGLVWGEPMFFTFGNPTRRQGQFYRVNFGDMKAFWLKGTLGPTKDTDRPAGVRIWDAEESEVLTQTEKENHAEWREFYGSDSDFYRVRVKGLPPHSGDVQFIPTEWIEAAQKRPALFLADDPLIAGCDLSWGGSDFSCIRFRRGMDARTIPPIRVPGELTKDEAVMVVKLSEVLTKKWNGRKVDMLFIDAAGSCGPIVRRLREMGFKNIIEVNFGGHSPDRKYKLARSYMWGQMKEAMPFLAIDSSPDLKADLETPAYSITKDSEILLEKKDLIIKRLGHSTDDADSLALSFFAPVHSDQYEQERKKRRISGQQIGMWT